MSCPTALNTAAACSMTGGDVLKTSPLTALNANNGATYTSLPTILPGTRAVVDDEADEEAQLEAEITAFAQGILTLIVSTVLQEIAEPDNRSAPEGKPILLIKDTSANTDAERRHMHTCPVNLSRFINRYIFNIRDKYISKLDEDSADVFSDCCLRIVEKVKEITRDTLTCADAMVKMIDENLKASDVGYRSFVAEILAHPNGGAYQGTPLANARSITDLFARTPLIKAEMRSISFAG